MANDIAFPADLHWEDEFETKALGIDRHAMEQEIAKVLAGVQVGHFKILEQRFEPLKIDGRRYSVRARLMEAMKNGGDANIELVFKEKHDAVPLPGHEKEVVKHRSEYPIPVSRHNRTTFPLLTDVALSGFAKRDAMQTERISYQLPDLAVKIELDRILKYRAKGETEFNAVDIPWFLEIEADTVHHIADVAEALGLHLNELEAWSKRDVLDYYKAR